MPEQFLEMMDEEENALQKIYLTGYVLELKKEPVFCRMVQRPDRLPFPGVCTLFSGVLRQRKSIVHKYLGFGAGMICYVCHVN